MNPVTANKRNMIVRTLEVIKTDATTHSLSTRPTVPELLVQISTNPLIQK
jgi:hypothetical protein